MKFTRETAIDYLKKEAELNIQHHNQSSDLWEQKIEQLYKLPNWYIEMFWYETYTEKITIIGALEQTGT